MNDGGWVRAAAPTCRVDTTMREQRLESVTSSHYEHERQSQCVMPTSHTTK
jgi:hypothetical protein